MQVGDIIYYRNAVCKYYYVINDTDFFGKFKVLPLCMADPNNHSRFLIFYTMHNWIYLTKDHVKCNKKETHEIKLFMAGNEI